MRIIRVRAGHCGWKARRGKGGTNLITETCFFPSGSAEVHWTSVMIRAQWLWGDMFSFLGPQVTAAGTANWSCTHSLCPHPSCG